MADKLRLGALDIQTNEYVSPINALKNKQYKCADCDKRVILRQGNIRVHHFAHYSETNTCSYYDHPNEAQIHKDAKLLLQKLMNDKRLLGFHWECDLCGYFHAFQGEPSFTYKEGDKAILEYRDKEGKWIADVALVNNGEVRCIVEVKNTHSTTTKRPEPWYEVDAAKFIKAIYDQYEDSKKYSETSSESDYANEPDYVFSVDCIRKDIIRRCYGSFCDTESWVRRIPGYYDKNDDNSCILCKKKEYDPTSDGQTGKFQNCQIRVCYDCLYQDIIHKKIRDIYSMDKIKESKLVWAKKGYIEIKESNQEFSSEEKELLKKIPTLPVGFGNENRWKQTIECFECGRANYSPEYLERKYYSVCKVCFRNEAVQLSIKSKLEKNFQSKKLCLIND